MGQKQEQTHRVLVADDERVIRQGLQVLITRYYRELTVLEASNGQECWDILSTEPQIRIAFVDIRMPEINGLQICEKMKMAGLPVKIVIISGFRDFEYARQALRYGVADYLLKPVNPSDVLRLVHGIVTLPQGVAEPLNEKQERLVIEQMRTWIHDHLHEEITLLDFSQRAHYSVSYLSALFKKETGKGFQEYLADCRLQRAKHLLQDPSLRISNIAERVGYTNAKAFAIAFRKACGITPTDYRERRGIDDSP